MSKARRLMTEGDRIVKAMDMEARGVRPSEKRKLTDRIRRYKADLNNLKGDLERASSKGDRDELLTGGGTRGAIAKESAGQRARLLEAGERMDKGTAQLQETRRTLMETEEVGVNIMGNLHTQRETLLRAHDKVKETNRLTGRARRVLNSIKARACTNQLLLIFIILVLLGLIGVVIYFGWVKPTASPNQKGSGSGAGEY